jgi:porphyrinogen peroxidase
MTQPGILAPISLHGNFLYFDLKQPSAAHEVLARLRDESWEQNVIGFGPELVNRLEGHVPGLVPFPRFTRARVPIPVTQCGLVILLRGNDAASLERQATHFNQLLDPAFVLKRHEVTFNYKDGRDLTGYKDGTENPEDRAAEVALASGVGPDVDGGSFVAIQTFRHDLEKFHALPQAVQDNIIGRRLEDNEELTQAPVTAHVKRTAQESFEPPAFVLRRSMPFATAMEKGLVFVAFGCRLDAFAALLERMVGAEDGQVDALFSFSTPINGGVYFCPPICAGQLNLDSILGSNQYP